MGFSSSYSAYRRHVYASINGTKGNLVKLSKSKLLSKTEKEKLLEVIEKMEELRVIYHNNMGKNKVNESETLQEA